MRSRVLTLALAGLTVVAAVVVVLSGREDPTTGGGARGVWTAVETTVAERSQPAGGAETTTPPAATASTRTALPTTTDPTPSSTSTDPTAPEPSATTTIQPPMATVPSTRATSTTYTPVPKPAGGPNTVAPGGALTKHMAADIAAAFGFDLLDVEAAIASVDLPSEAGGIAEGWLAPGTYGPPDSDSADVLVQAMVDRRVMQLEERGLPRNQWQRTLTAASVIEKETYNQNEKPGVARVLTNRLAGGGPLQMDSIILYPVPEDRIFTTGAERASDQPYNSYRHDGLPPTPISSPDEASIDAFLAPPPGDWWFYVTVDLHSGETRYAVTYEDHLVNVELLRAWLDEHPTP